MSDFLADLAARYAARADPTEAMPWKKPSELARLIEPARIQTPALDLMDTKIVEAAETPGFRMIWSMPPQEGKSEGMSHYGLLWLLRRNPDLRIAIASYEGTTAERWGKAVRQDILTYDGEDGQLDIGLKLRQDSQAVGSWQLEGTKGGIYSVGVGGALTGRPVDFLIIDDPIKSRSEADSLTYRDRVWDWWTNVARTRFAPGAPVILILTRWHEDDLAGRLIKQDQEDDRLGIRGPRWQVINIPAQAVAKDPLGRQPGEYLVSTRGRLAADWEAIKRDVGPRVWSALYQGNPTPLEGNLFHREAINRNRIPLISAPKMVTVREYIDPSFSDAADADETGRIVMGLGIDGNAYVLGDLSERKAYDRILIGSSHATHGTTGVRAEQNMLGKRVLTAIQAILPDHVSIVGIAAKGTKAQRAEGASNMVDNNRVKFVGRFDTLESQLVEWNPKDADSPDRLDAFVHGVQDLLIAGNISPVFVMDGPLEEESDARYQLHWVEKIDPDVPDFSAERDPEAGKVALSPFALPAGCANPLCDRDTTGVAYCCPSCAVAHENRYEIHEDGTLGHSTDCNSRTYVGA